MQLKITYVYTYEKDGEIYTGMACGFMPEDYVEILEERHVLYADEGKLLKNKTTGETMSAQWILPGDMVDNYEEIDDPEYEPSVEPNEE